MRKPPCSWPASLAAAVLILLRGAPALAAEPVARAERLDAVAPVGDMPFCPNCRYENKQLKRVNLRLGITDGTQTEVLGGELQPGMEVVTGIIVGNVRQTPQANQGNPLLPGRGGQQGGFGGRGRG